MDLTLAILKPDCVRRNLIGKSIDFIQSKGFRIICMKMLRLSQNQAEGFYAVHKERPFFNDLIEFMTSGTCVPMVIGKENAIQEFRDVIGATDPAKAKEGTLRNMYADNVQENIVHGSDSDENAKKEIAFFFSLGEIIKNS